MRIYEFPITHPENGLAIFPTRFPADAVAEMKREHGTYNFSCQFYLDPVPPEDQVFDPSWVRYWKKLPGERMQIVMCVDPASRTKKKSDYTAMVIMGWDTEQNWYILDILRDKLSETQRVDAVFNLHKKWQSYAQNKIKVLYETIGFQIMDKSNIERRQRDAKYFFPVVEMAGGVMHKTSKEDRIRALQPFFERGEVFVPGVSCMHVSHEHGGRKIDMMEPFIMEMNMFPRGVHDDMLDACTFPLYWDRFKNIRAEKVVIQDDIPDGALINWVNICRDVDNLREIPANAGFSDQELYRYSINL